MRRDFHVRVTLLAGIALALLAGGCSGGTSAPGTAPELRIVALDSTPQSAVDTLEATLTPAAGGYDVTIAATDDTPALDALYFSVELDGTTLGATKVEAAELSEALSLAVQPAAGRVDCGFAPVGDAELQLLPGDLLLSFRLESGVRAASAFRPEGTPTSAKPRNLELQRNDAGDWVLSWDYTNPGDTNQDGEVSMADITPLGANFARRLYGGWNEPLRHVDCDGNREINAADLTPIGANYFRQLYSYKIQMSMDGVTDFITVGELILGEQDRRPDQAIRFDYTFGAQYVSGAWYRVRPQTRNLEFGTPSEAINEGSRVMSLPSPQTETTVVVGAHELAHSLGQLNSVRVIYPNAYTYVPDSYNAGSPGGKNDDIDGFWQSFATAFLFMPEVLLVEHDLGDGWKAMDFNLTVSERLLPGSPAGTGDLFSFMLRRDRAEQLVLKTQDQSADGILRTYYTDPEEQEHLFGNSLALSAW